MLVGGGMSSLSRFTIRSLKPSVKRHKLNAHRAIVGWIGGIKILQVRNAQAWNFLELFHIATLHQEPSAFMNGTLLSNRAVFFRNSNFK
jgi:hypothetical protein